MKKLFNTIKYGSAKTKAVLLCAFLSFVGVLACLVCLIVWHEMLFLFGAIVCTFLFISLVQTLGIREEDVPEQPEMTELTDVPKQSETDELTDMPEQSKSAGQPEEPKKNRKTKKQKKHKKRKKAGKLKPAEEDPTRQAENLNQPEERPEPQPKEQPDEKSEEKQVQVVRPLTDETIATYDRKKIRKTMHRYKVKRDHRMILIDRSEKLHITQTPAYIWVEGKEVHLLLIEQEPRHISIPRYQFSEITYLKKQMVNEDMDYAAFKGKSLIADMFQPYLPDYTHSTVVDDLSAYKNLYGIGDIFVTNRSAKALFDLLGLELQVDDRVTMSNKVNIFFKDAYKANIMLRDNVIDANGYADRISNILDNLAHSTVSHAEFKDTLNLMIRNKLITQEFAMYYMGVRDNITK